MSSVMVYKFFVVTTCQKTLETNSSKLRERKVCHVHSMQHHLVQFSTYEGEFTPTQSCKSAQTEYSHTVHLVNLVTGQNLQLLRFLPLKYIATTQAVRRSDKYLRSVQQITPQITPRSS